MPYKDKAAKKAFDRRRYEAIKEYTVAYLLTHPCVDCGNSDLRVLEFDHEEKKSFSVGRGNSQTLEKVKLEIQKCKIRCANCHKIRHFEARGFMSKANATAASMAHNPAEMKKGDLPHAHSYPGKKAPKSEKVMDASHNQSALESGRKNSTGVSADGSHKGLPSSKDMVGDCK